ncbi:MAG: mismatch-specific DNA-glycosylase [Alphaproteobacteria bacterium]|nr:mismatch-specific DNA-glycosylase [Alphaproteobacteria bacterium]
MLPDVLSPGLKVVFCGSAAGQVSARVRAYYAGPGNKFWPTLHKIGLTPECLAPKDYADSLLYGIGLTDMTKTEFGADAELSGRADSPAALAAKIEASKPRALAFNGKRAATVFFSRSCRYGIQHDRLGDAAIFVLPSTSGAAARYWSEFPWLALAAFLDQNR